MESLFSDLHVRVIPYSFSFCRHKVSITQYQFAIFRSLESSISHLVLDY